MKTKCVALAMGLTFGFAVLADPSPCEGINTYAQLLTCAESRSPDVLRAESERNRAKAESGASGQLLNPQLDLQSVSGKDDQGRRAETEISLSVPVELGGKRSARKAVAEGELLESDAKLYAAKVAVRTQVYLSLHRLRQLIGERKLIDESVVTFQKLVRTYQSRPARSPEQEVTLSIFRVSQSDFELRRNRSDTKLAQMETYYRNMTGLGTEDVRKLLPKAPQEWPKVEDKAQSTKSAETLAAAAQMQIAKARLESAQAESWPTISVGPAVKMNREEGQSYDMVGATVSLPLPIFSLNKGGRAAAAASVSSAELNQNLLEKEMVGRREQLVKTYRQAVATLSSILSAEDLEKKHVSIERHFLRGTVPSALVIEAHRSLVELEEARNERQLEAMEMLLQIYALDGKLLEQQL